LQSEENGAVQIYAKVNHCKSKMLHGWFRAYLNTGWWFGCVKRKEADFADDDAAPRDFSVPGPSRAGAVPNIGSRSTSGGTANPTLVQYQINSTIRPCTVAS